MSNSTWVAPQVFEKKKCTVSCGAQWMHDKTTGQILKDLKG